MTGPATDAAGRERARLAGLLERLDDRLNPVFVKELRQAVRGRFFLVVFWTTLTVATLITALQLSAYESARSANEGRDLFLIVFGCMSFSVMLFVPLAAFLSMGSEWDDDTHEMLLLSSLRPGQIVRGKFLGAVLQDLLIFSTFVPFLAGAFLLHGLDVIGAAWVLVSLAMVCATVNAFSLAVSTYSQRRYTRVFLLALLSVLLIYSAAGMIAFAGVSIGGRGGASGGPALATLVGLLTAGVLLTAYGLVSAAGRLAHPEENHSSALRVLAGITLVAGIAWTAWGWSRTGDPDGLSTATDVLAFWIAFTGLGFVTERDRLGRRTRLQAPRNPVVALVLSPWLPGGGRGVLLLVLHAAVLVLAIALLPVLAPAGTGWSLPRTSLVHALAAVCYVIVFVVLPSALLHGRLWLPAWRVLARGLSVVLVLLAAAGPEIGALLLGEPSGHGFRQPGNPLWTLERIDGGNDMTRVVEALVVVALLVLLLNARRVLAALREVLAASRARRLREAQSQDPATGPDDAEERDAATAS